MESYIGCDIIDIDPGICLWSSKLHEFLKPRRHIFVESQEDFHKPWLRQLLDAPGTRYRIARFDTESPWHLGNYKEKGLLPEKEDGPVGSTGANGKRKILILANMTRHSRATAKSTVPGKKLESQQKVHEFVSNLEIASGFHCDGPVRMLAWMLDMEKTTFVPRTMFLKRRQSVMTERSCHVEEIVGAPWLSQGPRREAHVELESCIATAKRMSINGISIPSHRLDPMPHQLRENGEEALGEATILNEADVAGNRIWHQELLDLRKAFANGECSQFVGGPPGWVSSQRAAPGKQASPEFLRYRALETMNKSILTRKAAVDKALKLDEEIRRAELDLALDITLDEVQRADRTRDLDLASAQYQELLSQYPKRKHTEALFVADDRAAWNTDYPRLMWDQRTAEPIIAHPGEFYGRRPLALLDFQPKTTTFSTLTAMQRKYFDAILLSMFFNPTQSVGDALNGIGPGAAKAIFPHCPSLRDPLRGGRRCVDQLRVRMLTVEMIGELAVAWEKWKFGPTLAELMRSSRYLPLGHLAGRS